MHKEKKFCFNYCQIQKKKKQNEKCDKQEKKYVEINRSKAHTSKRIRVHSLLPVIVVAYNVP